MVIEKTSKIAAHNYVVLEDNDFVHGDLIEVKTGERKKMIKKIRVNLSASKPPEKLKNSLLDVAIVVHIRAGRFRRQDLDNLAKIILDALEKPKEDDGYPFLFNDDNQIVRLLLYKIERKEDLESETSQLSVSARVHDPSKEMILDNKNTP